MKSDEMRSVFEGREAPPRTLAWLKGQYLPLVRSRLNDERERQTYAIYDNERIPENERNLTDVRNRISILIEYKFAMLGTAILREHGVDDLFVSHVVANRFPDLEVRSKSGTRGLRIEVKAIETIAEEKAANFDALVKDIDPQVDYLVVFLWEWQDDMGTTQWDRAPVILGAFAFHCRTLASLRDWYWLNSPPADMGDGYQGFDMRHAITCRQGKYKQEEGNLGKLFRIWSDDCRFKPPATDMLSETMREYLSFRRDAVRCGFDALARALLPQVSGSDEMRPLLVSSLNVGWVSESSGFVLASETDGRVPGDVLAKEGVSTVFVLTDKYAWTQYGVSEGGLGKQRQGKKPKYIIQDRGED